MQKLQLICLFCLSLSLSAQPFIGAGNAMEFDGTSSSQATMTSGFGNFSLPVTVCAWVKPDQSNSAARLFYTHNHSAAYHGVWFQIFRGNLVIVYGDGTRRASTARRSGVTPMSPTPGEWIHVAGVIQGPRQMSLYVNGNAAPVTYSGSGGAMVASSGPGQIGGYPFGSNPSYFDGQMDELSFWDRALSQTEIRDLMCRKLSGNEPNLLAYYDFDQSGTTTLQNRVMGPDATVANANQFVPSSAPVGERSYWSHSATQPAVGFSLSNDSVVATPIGAGDPGVHIYFVDTLPNPMPGAQQVPNGSQHYLGVFVSDPARNYNLDYHVRNATLPPAAQYRLMRRDDNTATNWSLLTSQGNPVSIGGRPAPEQLLLIKACDLKVLPTDTSVCDSLNLSIDPRYINLSWSDGSTARSRIFTTAGQRVLNGTDTASGCNFQDTIDIQIIANNINSLPSDTLACDSLSLTIDQRYDNLSWSDGSTARNRTFTTAGQRVLNGTDTVSGCTFQDTINIQISNSNFAVLPSDTLVCDSFSLSVDPQYYNLSWSDGSTARSRTFTSAGQRVLNGTDTASGCTFQDTIDIQIIGSNVNIFPTDTSVCDSLGLSIDPRYINLSWSDGSTARSRIFTTAGQRVLNGTDTASGCNFQDTIDIQIIANNINSLPSDTLACDSLNLTIDPQYDNLSWSDGSTARNRTFTTAGQRVLNGTDTASGCTFQDTINIQISNSNFAVLPSDTLVCDSFSLFVDPQYDNLSWSDGSTARSRTFNTAGQRVLNGTDTASGCTFQDTIDIQIIGSNVNIFPTDTSVCDSLGLSIDPRYINLSWSDGSTARSRIFTTAGQRVLNGTDTASGCNFQDTIDIQIIGGNINILPRDTLACDSLNLTIDPQYDNLSWSDGSTARNRTFTAAGQHILFGNDTAGCPFQDTIDIQIIDSRFNIFPEDTTLCGQSRLLLDPGFPHAEAYQWSTGSSDSTLTVSNSGLYWVEVFINGGCSLRDSVRVNLAPFSNPIPEEEYVICRGQPIRITLDSLTYFNPVWSNGSTRHFFNLTDTGTYSVLVENAFGCFEQDTFRLRARTPVGMLQLYGDTVICHDEPVIFRAPEGDSLELIWPTGSDSLFLVERPTTVFYQITDGCTSDTAFFQVETEDCDCGFELPNAFTPNGDGINELFLPIHACRFQRYQLSIWNRWGMKVFDSSNPEEGWNGTLAGEQLPAGVYVYTLSFATARIERKLKGHLTLIR